MILRDSSDAPSLKSGIRNLKSGIVPVLSRTFKRAGQIRPRYEADTGQIREKVLFWVVNAGAGMG
jgi:hypothetical protein